MRKKYCRSASCACWSLFRSIAEHGKCGRANFWDSVSDEETISPHDPLLAYKKPQLVERLRKAQQQLQETQQQLAVSVDASVTREADVAKLEAKLAVLEPYRTFVMQMCAQMQREENGLLNGLPPDL